VDPAFLVVAVALVVLAGIVAVGLRRARVTVPEGRWGVVDRLGRYRRTLTPGRYTLVPTVETVLALVDMGEQVLNLPGTLVVTADNHTIPVDTVLRYQVVDPVRAVYEISDYRTGLAHLIAYALRAYLGGRNRDDAFASTTDTSRELRGIIDPRADAWGIKVHDVTAEPA
jgi:regulator of protease activity HflC (stomatin/prohibitin superfamily)